MANKIGKYSSFKDWLLWCRNKPNSTATKLASYLRRCEEDLLLKEPNHCFAFSEIHKILKEIDCGKRPSNNIEDAIEKLIEIDKAIGKEIKLDDHNQISEVEYDTLNGWQGAFNAYLKFLSDVTDCFNMGIAKGINSRIDCGGKVTKKKDRFYDKRVFLFRCGAYKALMEKLHFKLVEQSIDAFTESVKSLLGPDVNRNVVPTEFLIRTEDSSVAIINWRGLILNGIQIEDKHSCHEDFFVDDTDNEYYYNELFFRYTRNPKFKIKYRYDRSASFATEFFTNLVSSLLNVRNEINNSLGSTNEVFSFKECLTNIGTENSTTNQKDILYELTKVYNLLLEYSKQFKLVI